MNPLRKELTPEAIEAYCLGASWDAILIKESSQVEEEMVEIENKSKAQLSEIEQIYMRAATLLTEDLEKISQVNIFPRKIEEIDRAITELSNHSKSLEDHVKTKTEENKTLRTQLEKVNRSSAYLLSIGD